MISGAKLKTISILLFTICFSGFTHANNNTPLVDALITAKTTGMCGAIKQMTAFQESTKMPGGDEFIVRFIKTEAARLGKSLPEFLAQCETAVSSYMSIMNSLDTESQ